MPGREASVADKLPEPAAFKALLASTGPAGVGTAHRHLDDPMTFALCTLPGIVERVASVLGPDLLLWHSRYFDKPAGAPPIPWHQDAPFWNIEPKVCVSVWLALDRAHLGNGCMQALPGSHLRPLDPLKSEGTGRFGIKADPARFDAGNAVPLELSKGEFVLFDRWLLHMSDVNACRESRLALVMRFTVPEVRIAVDRLRPAVSGYGVHVVRGVDRHGLNPVAPKPAG